MTFIWAARGRDWGFRFLRTGGWEDPLVPYEAVFERVDLGPDACRRVGDEVALRMTDPEHRRDRAGRPIVHDFVLFGDLADRVANAEEGVAVVWPLVADDYAGVWDRPTAPPPFDA